MKKYFLILVVVLSLIGCKPNDYIPNGDGTMTVIEYPILNKTPVIIPNVPCSRRHSDGRMLEYEKGSRYVGIIGIGSMETYYDVSISVGDTVFKDRYNSSQFYRIANSDSLLIEELYYPQHMFKIIW